MKWNYKAEEAPTTGAQILAEIYADTFQVVSWFDNGWRENTNGLRLRNAFIRWTEIEA
jgi:hypothetical protein